MSEFNRRAHWQNVYKEKGEYQVSWFQDRPAVSLGLIEAIGARPNLVTIDIGGGASRLDRPSGLALPNHPSRCLGL